MADISTLPVTVQEQQTLMVREMASVIKFDCRDLIESGEQLLDPGMVGSPVIPAIPLKPSTIRRKERLGAIAPNTPRLRFGELEDSIMDGSLSADSAFVAIEGDELVAHFQQFGTARMPARPFFGISDRAETQCAEIQTKTQRVIDIAFRESGLPPQNIQVNIGISKEGFWAENWPHS